MKRGSDRSGSLNLFIGAACGLAVATIPFFFPHIDRFLAAALFDGSSIAVVVCIVLILIKERAD